MRSQAALGRTSGPLCWQPFKASGSAATTNGERVSLWPHKQKHNNSSFKRVFIRTKQSRPNKVSAVTRKHREVSPLFSRNGHTKLIVAALRADQEKPRFKWSSTSPRIQGSRPATGRRRSLLIYAQRGPLATSQKKPAVDESTLTKRCSPACFGTEF